MTKFTREQISEARQLADAAYDEARDADNDYYTGQLGDVWIDRFTDALGLDMEDERPKPGTWHVTRADGYPAYVEWDGDLIVFEPGALDHYRALANDWPNLDPATPPARVVPAEPKIYLTDAETSTLEKLDNARTAEPVQLSDGEVGEEWDASTAPHYWSEMEDFRKDGIMHVIRTLIAKHGHGRALPDSKQVREAIDSGFSLAEMTDAVMHLLGASK